MNRKSKIQRQPISDMLTGTVTEVDGQALLSLAQLDDGAAVAQGDLIIRYGITYLGKPHLSIVPHLVVADYGELLSGEAAWEFLMTSAHLYPRADVCGLRDDGSEDMVVLKQLDFDHPYAVFVYRRLEDDQPFAALSALIDAPQAFASERLQRHLPRFDSVAAWRRNG